MRSGFIPEASRAPLGLPLRPGACFHIQINLRRQRFFRKKSVPTRKEGRKEFIKKKMSAHY